MNREIIFRGKPVGKGGIWIEGIGAYKSQTSEHIIIDAKGASLGVVYLNQYTGLKDSGCHITEQWIKECDKVVIGNIYDNKELIKQL